jgi:hypothetical protein
MNNEYIPYSYSINFIFPEKFGMENKIASAKELYKFFLVNNNDAAILLEHKVCAIGKIHKSRPQRDAKCLVTSPVVTIYRLRRDREFLDSRNLLYDEFIKYAIETENGQIYYFCELGGSTLSMLIQYRIYGEETLQYLYFPDRYDSKGYI